MTSLILGGVAVAAVLFALWMGFRQARKRGEADVKVRQSNRILDDVEAAREAERRADDPDERKRLRSKFERSE